MSKYQPVPSAPPADATSTSGYPGDHHQAHVAAAVFGGPPPQQTVVQGFPVAPPEQPGYPVAHDHHHHDHNHHHHDHNHAPAAHYMVQDETVVLLPATLNPLVLFCPHCHRNVQTNVRRRPSTAACLCSALLCFLCWPCFWLPFCSKDCMDKTHQCPICENVLAVIPAAY